MSEQPKQEKDYFWYIIAAVVIAVATALWMVKSNEKGKYITAEQAIKEDKAFSAYR